MQIYYSSKFEREYKSLALTIKKKAEEKERLFRKNSHDLRLQTHKLKGALKDFWAFSIDRKNRIIFEFVDKNTVWFHSVGDHSIYD